MRYLAIAIVILFGFNTAFARSKRHSIRIPLVSYNQLMSMSRRQRQQYLWGVREMMIKLSHDGQFVSQLDRFEPNLWQLFAEPANADDVDNIRCIYGGFFITGAKCEPKQSVAMQVIENKQAKATTITCSGSLGLCNPILFGLSQGTSGDGICLPRSRNFTEQCGETSKATEADLEALNKLNKPMWESFRAGFKAVCANTTYANISYYKTLKEKDAQNRWQSDIVATCEAATQYLAKLGSNIHLASTGGLQHAPASQPPQKSTDNCTHFSPHPNAPVFCYACGIEASEQSSGHENYHVSENWLTLLSATNGLCGTQPTGNGNVTEYLLNKFGYCAAETNWPYTVDDQFSSAINKLAQGKPASSLTLSEQDAFKNHFGISVDSAVEAFCSVDTKNLTALATRSLDGINLTAQQTTAHQGFSKCAQEAIGIRSRDTLGSYNDYVTNGSKFSRSCKFVDVPYDVVRDLIHDGSQPVAVINNLGCFVPTSLSNHDKTVTAYDPGTGNDENHDIGEVTGGEQTSRRAIKCMGDSGPLSDSKHGLVKKTEKVPTQAHPDETSI